MSTRAPVPREAPPPLSPSAQRVQDALDAAGVASRVVEYAEPGRTSAEAAAVIGCAVAQIAKSLVFRAASGRPVLVIASGANRVDEAKVAAVLGEAIGRADPAFVRSATGYAIGGIPPLGHAQALVTLLDRDLLAHEVVYAAGGTPHAMFPLAPADLLRVSGGTAADVALFVSPQSSKDPP
ncbi:MAG TPA: YbaK/EbsC family protein [Casimicrobiaceae bacterium]|nr:YbaK/EbsC family protein [Casimicrobiaceae bacterium]